MTNAEIIFRNSVQLMEEGKLKAIKTDNGDLIPEPIHTFQKWKELGFSVKKGQKSEIKIQIWKCRKIKSSKEQKPEEEQREEEIKMFMTTACFFRFDQVERINADS